MKDPELIPQERIKMFPMERRVSYYRKQINDAVGAVLDSNSFILGEALNKFENEFAEYLGVNFCTGVANGTDAIELGLRTLNLSPATKVLTVANAGNYSSSAILACGLLPYFVDINSECLNLDFDILKNNLSRDVGAVILTHLYGNPIKDVDRMVAYCHSFNIPVLEDCAQAHGASVNGSKVGTYGDLSSFSFYPTKNLGALGDGGLVATNSSIFDKKVKMLRNYGWQSKYSIELEGGRNSRLDDFQASILSIFLKNLDRENSLRVTYSNEIISKVSNPHIKFVDYESGAVFHLLVLLTANRSQLIQHLDSCGINSDIHYPIMDNQQPGRQIDILYDLTNALTTSKQILSVPINPYLTKVEIDHLVQSLNSFRIKL
jgi:aminotransferase EvaB